MDAKISMNVSIMVVTPMQTVSILPVVSNAHAKKDSVEMVTFALISTNVSCLIHAEVKGQDASIPQAHTDVFVNKDLKVKHLEKIKTCAQEQII